MTVTALPAATWTELTAASVANAAIDYDGGPMVYISWSATEPTDTTDAKMFNGPFKIGADYDIADLFPSKTGPLKLWGYSPLVATSIEVTYAA